MSDRVDQLAAAIIGISEDYITSETHHPDYILIPVQKFEQLRTAEKDLIVDQKKITDRDELARILFWADVKHDDHENRIENEWRDRWWETNSDMPLSGPPFLAKWRAIADAALSFMGGE